MCAQGIPVFPSLSFGIPASPFALDHIESVADAETGANKKQEDDDEPVLLSWMRTPLGGQSRSGRTAVAGMAGNAMHAESVGVFLLFILTRGALSYRSITQNEFGTFLTKPGSRREETLNSTLWALGQWINGTRASPQRTAASRGRHPP